MYCNNIDLLAKYRVTIDGVTSIFCPAINGQFGIDFELMSIDKNDIKKLDTAGKLDYLLDAALGLDAKYEPITYERGLR